MRNLASYFLISTALLGDASSFANTRINVVVGAKSIYETGLANFKTLIPSADLTLLFDERWAIVTASGNEDVVALNNIEHLVRTHGTQKIQSAMAHHNGTGYKIKLSPSDQALRVSFLSQSPAPGPIARESLFSRKKIRRERMDTYWDCKFVHPIVLACRNEDQESYAVYLGRDRYQSFVNALGEDSEAVKSVIQAIESTGANIHELISD